MSKHAHLYIKYSKQTNYNLNMAKYKDTYNGSNIQFNSVDTILSGNSKKWGQAELANATDEDLVDIASDYGGKLPTIVNAVEIDWNGMVLGDKTINTTGELLSN